MPVTEPPSKRLKASAAASGAKADSESDNTEQAVPPVAASGAKVAPVPPAGTKFDAAKHAGMLGLPQCEPNVPPRPSDKDIIAGTAPDLRDWIGHVWKSVSFRLSVYLFELVSVVLRSPLYAQQTPPFEADKGTASGGVTSFKEPWDMGNCVRSLRSNSMYESSMTIWQFLASSTTWNGIDLATDAISWKQFDACDGLWSQTALDSSSQHADQARFIFPGFVPTAVRSVDAMDDTVKSKGFFRDLPACGGQAVMWSLIYALHCALEAVDHVLILKLFEASVTVTVRMRLAPSLVQIQLDSLSFIDVLRVQNAAVGATSFFEFAWAVLRFDGFTGKESGPELVDKLRVLGVQFKGKPVDKNVAYTILALVGLATDGAGQAAVRYMERINSKVFSDPTKIQRTFQTVKKLCSPDEWKDSVVAIMESMGVALTTGDAFEEDFSGDFLVPRVRTSRQSGYVASIMTKRKFFKWFIDEQISAAASGASSALSTQGLVAIKNKCSSPRMFWWTFHDETLEEDCRSRLN
jgi:hypothetical protein